MNQHNLFNYDTIRICLIDSTSFGIQERFDFKLALTSLPKSNRRSAWLEEDSIVFFDPNGEMMYVEYEGTLYEWKLRAREQGPEWWLGEE